MEPPDPEQVETFADFVEFVDALSRHFASERRGDDWQHWSVGDYLAAMAAWLRGDPILMRERMQEIREQPSWRGFAEILDAARVYE